VNPFAERLRRLLPGPWLGLLACVVLATSAASAVLDKPAFGTLARAIFAREAPLSLAFGLVILVAERRAAIIRHEAAGASQFSVEMMLAVGGLFCTVAGYYALEPVMEQVRLGAPSALSFLQWHAISLAFFGLKGLLVLALAWKATR
jgi:hypothetical protein